MQKEWAAKRAEEEENDGKTKRRKAESLSAAQASPSNASSAPEGLKGQQWLLLVLLLFLMLLLMERIIVMVVAAAAAMCSVQLRTNRLRSLLSLSSLHQLLSFKAKRSPQHLLGISLDIIANEHNVSSICLYTHTRELSALAFY